MSAPRILVVEDNPLNLKLVRDVLGAAGFDVVAATTGEEGLELAVTSPPDLVLMDLQLPGIDGVETMRRMRQEPDAVTAPIIAVTAMAMAEDHANVARAGFDGYIEKPISVRALVRDVHDFLRAGRP
jgi:two-component system, cell cycle response regulator DivK